MMLKFAAALALSFAALPAAAQEMEQADGWFIAQVRTGVCQMVAPFQGNTMISFIASDTLQGMFVLVDENWKLENGASYPVQYSWDGWRTSRAGTGKANLSSNGRYTIGVPMDTATNQTIRRAKKLAVRAPTVGIDSEVALPDGALGVLTRCMTRP